MPGFAATLFPSPDSNRKSSGVSCRVSTDAAGILAGRLLTACIRHQKNNASIEKVNAHSEQVNARQVEKACI